MKLVLPIYYKEEFKTKKDKNWLVGLNAYRNWHYFLSNKVKHFYHEQIAKQVGDSEPFTERVKITYRIWLARRGSDFHNVRSIVEKMALDGLVESKILVDDTDEYIAETRTIPMGYDKDNPRMEIEII